MENEGLPQTVASFAREIGLTRQALYKRIAKGELRARKAGHLTVIDPAEAAKFKARTRKVLCGGKEQTVVLD